MEEPVTIRDVATRAGVAISSVSAALNGTPGVSDATRQRVRRLAEEMGYVPSLRGKSLSARRAFALGLVIQREATILESDPFFPSFISGLESVLAGSGYALVLQMEEEPDKALQRYGQLAGDRRVDGVFLADIQVDDPRIELLQQLGMPAVGVNSEPRKFPFPSVTQDHVAGIETLISYLAESGHKSIIHVSGPQNLLHSRQREEAWRRSMKRLQLPAGEVIPGDFTYQGGRRAADRLIGMSPRPTAVFCANDLTAIGFMARAQDLGLRIPEDLSVAGYDGIEIGGYVRPALTTLRTSPRAIGAEAAKTLLDLIDGKNAADVEIPPAELLLRDSTGRAPAPGPGGAGTPAARALPA